MPIETPSGAQAIIDTVKDLHQPRMITIGDEKSPSGLQDILAVPEGMTLHSVKPYLAEYAVKPERRAGTASLADLGSFILHTNRHKDAESVVFAQRSEEKPQLLAVLDYNPAGPDNTAARFGKHRGVYQFPTSEAWRAWRDIDGKALSQADFAAFLEARIMDVMPVAEPDQQSTLTRELLARLGGEIAGPDTLLTTARGLRLHETAEVANAQNLGSGEVEVVYRTSHQDEKGQPLRVPSLFVVGMPVFDGDAAYQMPIRLRYRSSGGRITWTVLRYRPDLVFRSAFDHALEEVRKQTELPVMIGSPEV